MREYAALEYRAMVEAGVLFFAAKAAPTQIVFCDCTRFRVLLTLRTYI
jgi:hypothetical protein